MDKQDKQRRDEFKKHEMDKEHKRKEHLKELDEKARKEEEERYEALREKHLNASKNLHHPVSEHFGHKITQLSPGPGLCDSESYLLTIRPMYLSPGLSNIYNLTPNF